MKNLKNASCLLTYWPLIIAAAVLCGCAPHRPMRRMYLREYSPTVGKADPTKKSPLQGVTVSVKDFVEAFDYNAAVGDKNVLEPQGYLFSNIATNTAEKKLWNQDGEERIKSTKKQDWRQIGYIRNIFGARVGGVYATVPPGVWLGDTLKMDLAGQGAKIVGGENATVVIQGTIRHLDIEACFKYWADLIVDVEITVKGKPTIRRTLHTTPSQHTAVGSGSTFEFFKSLRQCQQKFSAEMIDSLEDALRQQDPSGK